MQCPIHKVEMKEYSKNGDSWFSHKDGDKWCNGKEKKAYTPNQALLGTAIAQIQAQLNRLEEKIDAITPPGVTIDRPRHNGPVPF